MVTSAFHMPRSKSIFAKCFQLAGTSLFNDAAHFCLDYFASSDDGIFEEAVLQARLEREALSLQVALESHIPVTTS